MNSKNGNFYKQDLPEYNVEQKNIIQRQNPLFLSYYKNQKIFDTDEEYEKFYECLRADLPIAFHIITKWKSYQDEYLLTYIEEIQRKFPDFIQRLSWYPGAAYSLSVNRVTLRTNPELKSFHKFLLAQSEAGTIVRQEVVSMIPVLCFDFTAPEAGKPRFFLDLCAAPGSKTSQLLQFTNSQNDVVIANDMCSKRGHMLIHRLHKLNTVNLIVTNHSAQFFPNIFIDQTALKYDAILCDVPCTGDGTFRKSRNLWTTWSDKSGLDLHRLQTQILRRAMTLCKPGGTIVYSTCSMNPIENEAVVGSLYEEFSESFQFIDKSRDFVGLHRYSGKSKWNVPYKNEYFETYQEFSDKFTGVSKVKSSMFPLSFAEDVAKYSMRFYPHLNNTGGFYVVVLRKVRELSTRNQVKITKEETPQSDENESKLNQDWKSQKDFISLNNQDKFECLTFWSKSAQPYGFQLQDHTIFDDLYIKFDAKASYPKHVWICTKNASKIIHARFKSPLKILFLGCVAFQNTHKDYLYRCTQQGIQRLICDHKIPLTPHLDRIASISSIDGLTELVGNINTSDEETTNIHRIRAVDIQEKSTYEAVQLLAHNAPCMIIFKHNQDLIYISIYKGNHNVELLLDKYCRQALIWYLEHIKKKITLDENPPISSNMITND